VSLRAQFALWLGLLVGFGVVIYGLRDILLPFVAGGVIAYLIDPLVDKLEARGLSRTLATTTVTVAFALVVGAALVLLAPLIYDQLLDLAQAIPGFVKRAWSMILADVELVASKTDSNQAAHISEAMKGLETRLADWLLGTLQGLWQSGIVVANLLSLVFITPIVTFYLMRDWDRIVAFVDGLLPRAQAATVRDLVRQIDAVLSGFIRGQAMLCLILAAFYGAGLMAVGLKFGLVIGLLAGLLSFIPYVGAISGLVASVGTAILQFDDEPWRIAVVAAIFVVGQILEANVLTPKLVGDRVRLHPVWVIFGVLAGGALFGFVGVLLAVPVSATIGVLVRFSVARYRASPLYGGGQ